MPSSSDEAKGANDEKKDKKTFLKDLFGIGNIIVPIVIFISFAAFYSANSNATEYKGFSWKFFYSIGEFYLDNCKVARGGYDQTTGEGETLFDCDLDSADSRREFGRRWGYGNYTPVSYVLATDRTLSSARYANHVHTLAAVGEVAPGCANDGGTVYECTECGARLIGDEAPGAGTHAFYTDGVRTGGSGERLLTYRCAHCDMTFTEVVEMPSPRLASFGDVNADGYTNARDVTDLMRVLVGHKLER